MTMSTYGDQFAGLLLLLVFPVTIWHTSLSGVAAAMIIVGVVGLKAWFTWIPRWLIYQVCSPGSMC